MKVCQFSLLGLLCLLLTGAGCQCAAAEDSRLRTVEFDPGQVVPVYVQQGYAVQIVLGTNEHIEAAGSGVNSHCEDPAALWCIVAHKGEHDVYVNVHPGATMTNLFVQTDRRNYSFDLIALPESSRLRSRCVYRMQFTYPDEIAQRLASAQNAQRAQYDSKVLEERLKQPPLPRNWNYTMEVMPGGESIAPTMMYDDGLFTYISFPNNREIPTIYMVSDDKSESVVQWHVDNDTVVVHRVARRFVLRDGRAVVGLWNESYDPNGVPPVDGVTAPGVSRTIIRKDNSTQQADLKPVDPGVQTDTSSAAQLPSGRATSERIRQTQVHQEQSN